MIRRTALLLALASPAAAEQFTFCWAGSNGYTMTGQMTVAPEAMAKPRVTEDDITAFAIEGYLNGKTLGRWDLSQLTPDTSWNLNFDPRAMRFFTGGHSDFENGQAWNANGVLDNCGNPGFGFNSGSGSQDVCVNNTWRTDSIIAPDTPFQVFPEGVPAPCARDFLLSGLDRGPVVSEG